MVDTHGKLDLWSDRSECRPPTAPDFRALRLLPLVGGVPACRIALNLKGHRGGTGFRCISCRRGGEPARGDVQGAQPAGTRAGFGARRPGDRAGRSPSSNISTRSGPAPPLLPPEPLGAARGGLRPDRLCKSPAISIRSTICALLFYLREPFRCRRTGRAPEWQRPLDGERLLPRSKRCSRVRLRPAPGATAMPRTLAGTSASFPNSSMPVASNSIWRAIRTLTRIEAHALSHPAFEAALPKNQPDAE